MQLTNLEISPELILASAGILAALLVVCAGLWLTQRATKRCIRLLQDQQNRAQKINSEQLQKIRHDLDGLAILVESLGKTTKRMPPKGASLAAEKVEIAISLAAAGESAENISRATGLSDLDVNTIIRFHKNKPGGEHALI